MSGEEEQEKERFFNWLGGQGVVGKILQNLMNVTTEVIDTEGSVAGRITENIFLGDTKLEVIDPMYFVGTEYYDWAIAQHEKAVQRISDALFMSLRLGKQLLGLFVKFIGLPVV